jgi:hypothetical protein
LYPGLGVVDVEKYTETLTTVFTADTFGDFFGCWMALRRQIAGLVKRSIEPLHSGQMAHGSEGLGLHLFPSEKTAQFFIKGVKPVWEDPMCATGGKIVMTSTPAEVNHLLCYRTGLIAFSST